ncbi:MAG: hypothetical protein HY841_08650 [Bacteroidetes bacterium]|nr:hypothetical protein [Bacteroidota bacterium]
MAKKNQKIKTPPQKAKSFQPRMLSFLWVIVLLGLSATFILQMQKPNEENDKEKKKNEEKKKEKVKLSMASWFNLSYQRETEEDMKSNSPIGKQLIPFKNQLDYDLFDKINVKDFVVGKEGYIFSIPWIEGYLGRNFIGEKKIEDLLQKAKAVQDTLKKKNIDLVLIYAPGKGTYCKDFLPEKFLKYPKSTTNYEVFVSKSKELGLNYIDLQEYFLKLKPTAKYPLFAQFAHHWTSYGECLAIDSVIKYIEKIRNSYVAHLTIKEVLLEDKPKYRDADIIGKAKLMSAPTPSTKYAFPKVAFQTRTDSKPVKVLGIGDSYYRGFLYLGAMRYAFDNGEYWYYNNKVTLSNGKSTNEVWELDLKKEIEKNNVILILYSDGSLANFGNGFIQNAYQLYTNPEQYLIDSQKEKQLSSYKKKIRNNPSLLNIAVDNAEAMHIDIDSAITLNAIEMAAQQNSEKDKH